MGRPEDYDRINNEFSKISKKLKIDKLLKNMNKTNISIVCPVYREQDVIENFYNELKKSENDSNFKIIKIIFVIDQAMTKLMIY